MRHQKGDTKPGAYDGSAIRHKGAATDGPLLTPADVARLLDGRITPAGVVKAAETGRLPVAMRTVSGIRLFTREAAEQFKREREERIALALANR